MNIFELIERCTKSGVFLFVEEGQLRFKLSVDVFPETLKTEITENKQEIIEFLTKGMSSSQDIIRPEIKTLPRIDNVFELSFAQQRLWFIDKMGHNAIQYNMSMAFEVSGKFDMDIAEQALSRIINRHETLRTVFSEQEDGSRQLIRDEFCFKFNYFDLRNFSEKKQMTLLSTLIAQDKNKAFDLSSDLMVRASYVQVSDNIEQTVGTLLFNMHHIASDGWSMDVLIREFVTLYESIIAEQPDPLLPLEIQYADYANWQREYLQGDMLASQLSYWDKQLADLPSIHSLILDETRPEEKQYAGARVSGQLSGDIARSLQHIAKAHQLTPFMLLHAALALVLARHSNSHDIVIGTPVANRLQTELEPLIGFFVNTLVLRLDTNHQDLSDYLAHVREVHLDAQSNQDVPFERLVEQLNISRSSAYTPVFQIMLTTDTDYGLGENKERQELTLPGVTLSPLESEHITAKFDLDIRISLNENGVNLEWVFDKAIFNEAHIAQFNDHLSRLLTGLATVSETELVGQSQIKDLPMLSTPELDYLLTTLNDTEQGFPTDKCIHELFEAQALVTPNNIAVVFEDEQFTYQALNQRANRVAHYLNKHHEITPDTLVGICVERSLQMVVGILGILKAGGAYVPLDPSYPEARLNYILSDADVSLVLTQESLLAKVGLGERQAVCLDGELLEHDPSATDQTDNLKKEALGLNSSHLAYVIYTSGSTGQPKGVAIRHSNTNAMLHWANSTFAPDELSKVLASTSLNFDLSVFELFVPLCFGYQCILVKDALALIEQPLDVSLINTVPSVIKVLLENKSISDSVKLVNLAGEPLNTEIVNEILNNTNCTKVYNLYGPSEDTTYSTYMAFTSTIKNKPEIGRVIANSQAFVLTDGLELAPFGVAGELYLSGAGVAKGYLNKPELTAERFIENPYYDEANHNSSKCLYKTGDLVRYLPDGNLEYINRIDDQVKIRGFRIELGEIESHINKQAEVDSVLVLAKELMVEEKQLVAYVKRTAVIQTTPTANEVKEEDSTVLTDGAFITSLKEAIANELPSYMVPSLFVIVPEWPLMPNGKINRNGLPEPDATLLQNEYIAPETVTEKRLVAIWSSLLKLDEDKISTRANFFSLGGHSLLVMRFISELGKRHNIEIALTAPFKYSVLANLAVYIDQNEQKVISPITVINKNQPLPLSYPQQRLWFIDKFSGSRQYSIPIAIRLIGKLNKQSLNDALKTIVDRHEILRTIYKENVGKPVQVLNADTEFSVKFVDLTSLIHDKDQQEQQLKSLIHEDVNKTFDLSQDLMLRVTLFELSEQNSVVQFNMHHIASDGWSQGILIEEFVALYFAYCNGQPNPLDPLPIQYSDYAFWQKESFTGTSLAPQLAYWKKQLKGLSQLHSLPLDRVRPAKQDFSGAKYEYTLDSDLLNALNEVATKYEVTLFMLLYSVFSLLLARWSNEKDIVIGSPIAGRNHPDLAPLIGFFTNTLVLRSIQDEQQTFEQLLHKNKQMILDAFHNQDLPFENLVDSMKLKRSLSHAPLFQVMFTMQNKDSNDISLPDLILESFPSDRNSCKFDLELMVFEQSGELSISWTYAKSLFAHQSMVNFGDSFKNLLLELSNNKNVSELPAYQLSLVDRCGIEQSKSMEDVKTREIKTDSRILDCAVHHCFEQQADANPNNTALVFNDVTLTYAQLDVRANQLAHALIDKGIKAGNIVGLCSGRSVEMVVGVLAIMKVGAAYLPLDPGLPHSRLEYMARDSGIALALVENTLMSSHVFSECEQLVLGDGKCFDHYSSMVPTLGYTDLNSLCYVIYTSGSTGKPKGVKVPHSAVVHYLAHAVENYLTDNIVGSVLSSPLSFDATVTTLITPLMAGRKIVILPEKQYLVVEGLINYFNAEDDYLFKITPAHLELLSTCKISGNAQHIVVIGGEQLTTRCLMPWKRDLLPNTIYVNEYGPTETAVGCSTYWIRELQDLEYDVHAVPIGQPINNIKFYVLYNGQPIPLGAIGELYIGGDGVTHGYLNNDELTNDKFVKNSQQTDQDDIIYRTGDLVRYRHDGNLEFIGRIDDQLKVRGYRIEVGEIEAQLVSHDKIKEAVVLAKGEGIKKHLVAYYTINQHAPKISELKGWLKVSLAEYMIPTKFIEVDKFILTNNGKVDKKSLSEIAYVELGHNDKFSKNNNIEDQLSVIWCEILQLDNISINDNFFESGGNSLLSVEVQKAVSDRTGYQIELTDIFEYPTIKSLSGYLTKENELDERAVNTDSANTNSANTRRQQDTDIAVIGMSGRFPGADNIDEFWGNISAGVESIQFFDDNELLESGIDLTTLQQKNYVKSGHILNGMKDFDANYFSFSPRDAELLDPQQRLILETASQALEHGGYGDRLQKRNVGVFVGVGESQYLLKNILSNPDIIGTAVKTAFYGNSSAYTSTRLSYKLNLTGPSINVLTACSTSLVTVHQACNSLMLDECEMAIAGGACVSLLKPTGYLYEEGGISSIDGHCRPFDNNAQGTRGGSGVAIVLLKRLDKALEDKDTIHAIIKGTAVNNDGADKVGFTAPGLGGQADVISKALLNADVSATTIQYVEAHGTGTVIGDPIEFKALQKAYCTSENRSCALGAVKANIGHLDTAAGVAGMIKVIQSLKNKQIPPSINFDESNSQINFNNSPFYINTELKPWDNEDNLRRAGLSSFGIGGTNAHVIFEQAPNVESSTSLRDTWLLPLSAMTKTALNTACENLRTFLQENKDVSLHDVAYTLQVGRTKHEYSTALACKSVAEAISLLTNKQKVVRDKGKSRSVVFMFPGQGAQYINMGQQLYLEEPLFKALFDQCADLLLSILDEDLRSIIYPQGDSNPDNEYNKTLLELTRITQPALFVIEYCLAKLLQSWGIEPDAMLGHSIGEYVAACLAGVFDLEDAIKLVSARGRLMQQVESGTMLSVSITAEQLKPLLVQTGTCLAGINSVSNCIASGKHEAITRLTVLLDELQIVYRPLHTSHAYHSKMMDVILDDFKAVIEKVSLRSPTLPYVSNVTGRFITSDQAQDPQYWVDHLRGTVLFADGVDTILSDREFLHANKVVIEVGPGITLSTLARKNIQAREHATVSTMRHPNESICDLVNLQNALGKLWGYGVNVNWQAFHQEHLGRRVPLPTYPFERVRYWIEPVENNQRMIMNTETKLPMDKWWSVPTWKQKPGFKKDKLLINSQSSAWLLIMDDAGVGEGVAECLLNAGHRVIRAYSGKCFARVSNNEYTFDISQEADYLALIRAASSAAEITRVVHLLSIDPMSQRHEYDMGDFWSDQKNGTLSALYTIKGMIIAGLCGDIMIDFITNDIERVSGEEIINPGKATITSLCKVAPQEYSELECHHIDVKLHQYHDNKYIESLSQTIARELVMQHRCSMIALRGNQRWEKQYETDVFKQDMPAAQVLKNDGVYLITGGLGNIGLLLAGYISKTVKNAKLILVGRSDFPARDDWKDIIKSQVDQSICKKIDKIQTIQARGTDVVIHSADTADGMQMQTLFETVEERCGVINGIIHCAGQVHGSMKALIETEKQDFEKQYRSKVNSVIVLDELLRTRQPDFCLLMSSLASVLGGLGFSAYAATNIFMDAFVQRKHDLGDDNWISVNWDSWNFSSAQAGDSGYNNFAMTPEEGEQAFKQVLAGAYYPQLIHSTGSLDHRLSQWIAKTETTTQTLYERPDLETDYVKPTNEVEEILVAIWQNVLGIEQIGIQDHFFDLGGDSLIATRVISAIRKTLSVNESLFSIRDFFENPIIELMAKKISINMSNNNINTRKAEFFDAGKSVEEGVF